MAPDKPLTPEKELLNLIEKPVGKVSLQQAAIKYHSLSLFSFGALKGRLAFLESRIKNFFKPEGLEQLNLHVLNQALKFCVFILAVYFAGSLAFSIVNLKKEISLNINIEKPQEIRTTPVPSLLKALSYYLEKSRERDIFNMGRGKPVLDAGLSKGPSARILEATQHLKLVGISWSSDPDVMIEDTKGARTLFLKKGQTIDSDIKLKAVFKDKVIISYGQEEIELR